MTNLCQVYDPECHFMITGVWYFIIEILPYFIIRFVCHFKHPRL